MAESRNALIDLKDAAGAGVDILEYLEPASELRPALIATKPDAVDDFLDHVIDTAKWDAVGTVTEQTFLGIDGLSIQGPTTPDYDVAGVIYKPAIVAQVGKLVMCRFIMQHPVEFLAYLQEYAFTVDSVVTPTTWTLKYKTTPQDLRNSMGLKFTHSGLYFFEGGQVGNSEKVASVPAIVGQPIEVGFLFTATGFSLIVHLPGIWDAPQTVKEYTRPGGTHAVNGYSLCVNLWTADDILHFYDPAFQFKSNALVQGARIITANKEDYVVISSLNVPVEVGYQMFQQGTVNVRIPDYSAALLTLEQVAQVTSNLTGKQVYPIEFELNGDVAIRHPVRIVIEDNGLPLNPNVNGE